MSFVQVGSFEAADGSNLLGALSVFKAFTAEIQDRCEEAPVDLDLNEVGFYALFGVSTAIHAAGQEKEAIS
jgi:hypothetical protein